MKDIKILLIILLTTSIFFACDKEKEEGQTQKILFQFEKNASLLPNEKAVYPNTSFVIFSDTHLYKKTFGTNGKAFEHYIENDRKLLVQSEDILKAAIQSISEIEADFVLIPGDLTKDGERDAHQSMSEYLHKLKESGKQVFVIPGNHDIKSAAAKRFLGEKTERVETINAKEFKQIYKDFGYSKENQCEDSLSYATIIKSNLLLIGLDTCRHRENNLQTDEHPITSGKLYPKTLIWLEEILIKAASNSLAVIIMSHHGWVEHWQGQSQFHPEYLLENYQRLAYLASQYNARIVFSGHYHAQDIAIAKYEDKFIFDIETGSFVTYPNPIRVVRITSNKMKINSFFINDIEGFTNNFLAYSKDFLQKGLYALSFNTLTQDYGFLPIFASRIAPQSANAFMLHYKGDEKFVGEVINKDGVGLKGIIALDDKRLGYVIKGLVKDSPTADNNVLIDLDSAKTQEITAGTVPKGFVSSLK